MQARRGRRPYPGLVTPAEEKVLRLVRDGLTNAEIAERLGLTLNTVKYHVANLLAKAGASSREQLGTWKPGGHPKGVWPQLQFSRWLMFGSGASVAVLAGVLLVALATGLSRYERPVQRRWLRKASRV